MDQHHESSCVQNLIIHNPILDKDGCPATANALILRAVKRGSVLSSRFLVVEAGANHTQERKVLGRRRVDLLTLIGRLAASLECA